MLVTLPCLSRRRLSSPSVPRVLVCDVKARTAPTQGRPARTNRGGLVSVASASASLLLKSETGTGACRGSYEVRTGPEILNGLIWCLLMEHDSHGIPR